MAKLFSKSNPIEDSISQSMEKKAVIMKGKVIANALNIRAQANKEGTVVGKLVKDNMVEIISKQGDWYEIKFNDSSAFVFAEFIEEILKKGIVNANLLNIRSLPNKDADKLAQITKDTEVIIVEEIDEWYKIKVNDGFGYVFSEFIKVIGSENVIKFLVQDPEMLKAPLEPSKKLDETGTKTQVTVKSIYNKYGNLLSLLSKKLGIDLAASIAVLSVESGGVGMANGRVLIRFENHLFYKYWGKFNQEIYQQHFKFGAGKNWLGHQFRKEPDGDWIDFHGNQDLENEVFDFASSLDYEKAVLSISMGLPQILGSNSRIIGYDTPQQMYEAFSKDIRFHLIAFFDFLSPQLINAFKRKDFITIAEHYNGRGQAAKYGKFISDYYNSFPSNLA